MSGDTDRVAGAWRQHNGKRWGVAIAAAFVAVAVLAYVAKWTIEGVTAYSYEIHWLETVPVLVLIFAYFIQREMRP